MIRTRTIEEATTPAEAGRLETLYARHAPEAARLAYLLTGDRALAEDLTQEAFVRMFGKFRDLRNPEAFGAYLRKTVVNLARTYFRRRGVEHTFLEKEAREPIRPVEQTRAAPRDVVRFEEGHPSATSGDRPQVLRGPQRGADSRPPRVRRRNREIPGVSRTEGASQRP